MEDRKKNLIKIGVYLSIFIIAIIYVRISSITDNKSTNKKQQEQTKAKEYLSGINENYYKVSAYITLEGDALTLEYEKVNDIEIGKKVYHGASSNYLLYNNKYYEIVDEELNELNNFNINEYDLTFVKLNNLKRLLEIDSTQNSIKEIKIQDAINLYNSINDTHFYTLEEKYITVEIKENNVKLDLTSLYNLINQTEEKFVKYELTYNQSSEEDTSWISEYLK